MEQYEQTPRHLRRNSVRKTSTTLCPQSEIFAEPVGRFMDHPTCPLVRLLLSPPMNERSPNLTHSISRRTMHGAAPTTIVEYTFALAIAHADNTRSLQHPGKSAVSGSEAWCKREPVLGVIGSRFCLSVCVCMSDLAPEVENRPTMCLNA